ncbi:DUF305 domain-containing protein [Antiquaquibacter soli]|uniref:DUF305 domain-containing protein n=1 Tax=Antiquaquibacter soli TaxID=3064523 RepID=A0ABT9BIU8_9MICO|nr:DUF305 domain-containing protein [Protaetiibacter sp. WY-16]MDO7880953.1 DUF305 domain-containing protein [Protaetiibacter sp. WY-16]
MADTSPEAGAAVSAPRRGGRLLAALLVAALVLAVGAFAIGRFSVPSSATPSTTSADAGFARDMQVHHLQAVEMSMTVRDLTDDPDVRLLAYDIATSQAQQAGQMYGWLATWGLPQFGEPAMTWMSRPLLDGSEHGHDGPTSTHKPGDPMPGLATDEQLAELASLTGVEAERYYLELMIAHHKGGVEMAEAVLARTDTPVVVDLASSIVKAQTSEIELMESMLAERQ